ncbi:hypothetical protein N2152v2_010289 [Parachlorella kessleri]
MTSAGHKRQRAEGESDQDGAGDPLLVKPNSHLQSPKVVPPGTSLQQGVQPNLKSVNTLLDPSLEALKACPEIANIPAKVVSVASPLSVDTRQKPHAANVLNLRLSGEGAPEGGCPISIVELANVSGYYSGLATHEQPSGSLELPVGHAGVELLVEAVYTKQVQLDGKSVVDLLQAASYLQVECCLEAAGQFLPENAFHHCPAQVLEVARSLGLQALHKRLLDCLARRFFRYNPFLLATVLKDMGTEAAVQLLQRDDLCCPLECFLVEVEEAAERQIPQQPEGQPRAAAKRTLQLLAEVDSDGSLVAAESAPVEIKGVAIAYLRTSPRTDCRPTELLLSAVDKQFGLGLRAVFLSWAAVGQHHMDMGKVPTEGWGYSQPGFLDAPLKQPLCPRRGSKKVVLLACYLPEQ